MRRSLATPVLWLAAASTLGGLVLPAQAVAGRVRVNAGVQIHAGNIGHRFGARVYYGPRIGHRTRHGYRTYRATFYRPHYHPPHYVGSYYYGPYSTRPLYLTSLPYYETVYVYPSPDEPPPEDGTLRRGRLHLRVEPPDAAVYLDGEFLARGDELSRLHGALPVAEGEHTIEVVRPGYVGATQDVIVGGDGPTTLRIELEPKR